VHGSVAAEGQHLKVARVAAALGRHRTQRPRHRRIRNAVHAPCGILERYAERSRDVLLQRTLGQVAANRETAAGSAVGLMNPRITLASVTVGSVPPRA
jgi:hypothetical protein